jgi:hypothetical protein
MNSRAFLTATAAGATAVAIQAATASSQNSLA